MLLAGDIGGTKVDLALCKVNGLNVEVQGAKRYSSARFSSLAEVIHQYLGEAGCSTRDIDRACFGVPGAVVQGRCKTVNLPWNIELSEVERMFPSILMNDLATMAHGLRVVSYRGERDGNGLAVVRKGKTDGRANQALIAPGTGLGEAVLYWDGKKHVVSPSEGGHTDFGPQDEEQIELLRWLWTRHKHVSWEHVCSGPAIHRIYRFLKETGRAREPKELEEQFADPGVDPSPVIAGRAAQEDDGICARTMSLWLFLLGAEAGNLALKTVSLGGIFLGGGVVPKILDLLKEPEFSKGFETKGRISAVLEDVPVFAVTDPHVSLYGSALCAAEQAGV